MDVQLIAAGVSRLHAAVSSPYSLEAPAYLFTKTARLYGAGAAIFLAQMPYFLGGGKAV